MLLEWRTAITHLSSGTGTYPYFPSKMYSRTRPCFSCVTRSPTASCRVLGAPPTALVFQTQMVAEQNVRAVLPPPVQGTRSMRCVVCVRMNSVDQYQERKRHHGSRSHVPCRIRRRASGLTKCKMALRDLPYVRRIVVGFASARLVCPRVMLE